MDLARFRRLPLMGILRGGRIDDAEPLLRSVIAAGLETLEVTMNTPGAPAMIHRMRSIAGDRLMLGAGTVLSIADVEAALLAGATFIVSPTFVPEVVAACRQRGVPVFPGALTPTEIHAAWQGGATMVKLFPAQVFGASYIREVRGPFADIEILACGGVRADNAADYFAAGAAAVAFGGSVLRPQWLDAGAYDQIGEEIEKLVTACRTAAA